MELDIKIFFRISELYENENKKMIWLTTSDAREYLLKTIDSKGIHLIGLLSLSPRQW